MADRLPALRERLRQQDPELAADLDLQWRIANSEWLPAVPPQFDSSNSGPHLANIESHLDETFAILHQHKPSASVLEMRPIEVYMMLAAVLFHDLGRAKISSGHGPDPDHGAATQELLAFSYQNLGVRNREVALSLGRICGSHTADPEIRQACEHRLRLGDVVIDPYGQVRERMIAALLTLGDCMDSAQTRVVPDYLRKAEERQPVGAFRNLIRGVVADPASRCIRTILVANESRSMDPGAKALDRERPPHFVLNSDPRDLSMWTRRLNAVVDCRDLQPRRDALARVAKRSPTGLLGHDSVEKSRFGVACERGLASVFGELRGEGAFDLPEQLVAWRILHGAKGGSWPRRLLVAVVLGDLRANRIALRSIREHLAAVGLPLATWLVEHQERLYTPDCCETYEPVLHRDYLSDVVDGMWELSARVFGASEFTYCELASQLGERNVARVRTAVRRIAIATTRHAGERDVDDEALPWPSPIWIGDETWKWRVDRDPNPGTRQFGSVSWVKQVIGRLRQPDDPAALGGAA